MVVVVVMVVSCGKSGRGGVSVSLAVMSITVLEAVLRSDVSVSESAVIGEMGEVGDIGETGEVGGLSVVVGVVSVVEAVVVVSVTVAGV